jgi:putative cardiolipin synthase
VAVHGGYSARRNDLLDAGAHLSELRPDAARAPGLPAVPGVPTTLHAKAGVVDGTTVFLGSANLDQRSGNHNTEMILVVESPALAARVARFIRDGMDTTNAWPLRRDGGDTVWLEPRGDAIVEHHREPETGAGRRAAAALFRILPIKGEL